jgi:hypothetical protein
MALPARLWLTGLKKVTVSPDVSSRTPYRSLWRPVAHSCFFEFGAALYSIAGNHAGLIRLTP